MESKNSNDGLSRIPGMITEDEIRSNAYYITWLTNYLKKIDYDVSIGYLVNDIIYNNSNEIDIINMNYIPTLWKVLCKYAKKAYITKGYNLNIVEWYTVKYQDVTFVISRSNFVNGRTDFKCYRTRAESFFESTEIIDFELILKNSYSEESQRKIDLVEKHYKDMSNFIKEAKACGITRAQLYQIIDEFRNLICSSLI